MSQTVIAIFNSTSEAHDAIDEILNNGIPQESIDFSSGGAQGVSTTSADSLKDDESGISKFFKNLFGSDNDDSDRYAKAAGTRAVVTVHARTAEEAELAADILDEKGAVDVNEGSASYSNDSTTGMKAASMNASADFDDATEKETRAIPIIEETLQVGKKEVETGGVRLRSRIVEKPVEESLRLREEYIRVERNAVDRAATSADLNNFQEGTIEMVQHAEIPVVAKEARVVEEVSLGKDVEHREETIRDTVRKTEVDVEEIETENNRTGKTI